MENNVKEELDKLCETETIKKISKYEINSVIYIAKLIENKKMDDLQKEKIRNNIMEVIYKDCIDYIDEKKASTPAREKFRDEYETIYDNSDNEVLKTAFGKKWTNGFNYDYDASLIANYVYCKAFFAEKTNIKIEEKQGYEHIISYCNKNSNDRCFFRGDTMNSWSTTLDEFCRLFGGGQEGYLEKVEIYEGKGRNRGKWCIPEADPAMDWVEFLSDSNNYKKELPSYITDFMKVVYTIGNFIPVPIEPESFNTKRSKFTCDYWDLTLLAIYEYYMHGERPTIAQTLLVEWAFWFDGYGTGQAGWDSFVEENYMKPFVNKIEKVEGAKYGMPYELWDNHFKDKSMLPQEKWQFEQFFVNAKVRILERGKLIAKALVGELPDENKTQK